MAAIAAQIYPEGQVEEEEPQYVKKGKRTVKVEPKRRAPTINLMAGWEGCHEKYRELTYKFIMDKVVTPMADQREERGLPKAATFEEADEYEALLKSEYREWRAREQTDSQAKCRVCWTMPTR